jgi:isopenicillin-N N-acyltransferase like protein
MTIPTIKLSGSPYDIGLKHGQAAKNQIKNNVKFYFKLWNYFSGTTKTDVINDIKKFIPYIERFDPSLLEEIEGIAAGSEMSFEEILALNSRWELNYAYTPSTKTKAIFGGCTSYALMPSETDNQHTYIGQNWDYKATIKNGCALLMISQENKPDLIISTEAGIIGHKGFNSYGIGVCVNYLRTSEDRFSPGIPILLKVRKLLESKTLSQCINILTNFAGPNSANILLAHGDGEIIDVECMPDDNFFVYPDHGIITHANHFLSPIYPVKDVCKKIFPDSLIRQERALRLFKNCNGDIKIQDTQDVLKDHFGYPDSLCRHPDDSLNPYEQWETITSIIIDLSDRKMLYTAGNPCMQPYKEITLNKKGYDKQFSEIIETQKNANF